MGSYDTFMGSHDIPWDAMAHPMALHSPPLHAMGHTMASHGKYNVQEDPNCLGGTL